MEPKTLETVVEGLKIGSQVVGASAVLIATFFGGVASIMEYSERKYLVNQMMPAYRNGDLSTKPSIFNIYRITDSETAYL